jgi:hypoxanthine phosphoribosyltransferase
LEIPGFRVLIDEDRIQQRIKQLARRVSEDYREGSLHLVGVMRGAYQFTRDLSSRLALPHTVDFISVASYGEGTESSGRVILRQGLAQPIQGKDVLIVEDIVDTGLTLNWLIDHVRSQEPRSLRTCCLLSKPARRQVEVPLDYLGFPIEDLFVIGYGLDYQEKYRELPFISCLAPGQAA